MNKFCKNCETLLISDDELVSNYNNYQRGLCCFCYEHENDKLELEKRKLKLEEKN